jgi:hypothetical protein
MNAQNQASFPSTKLYGGTKGKTIPSSKESFAHMMCSRTFCMLETLSDSARSGFTAFDQEIVRAIAFHVVPGYMSFKSPTGNMNTPINSR